MISPADGTIKEIIHENNKTSIVITLYIWNKHYQVSPINGIVKDIKYKKGKFLNALFTKATSENERNEISMQNKKIKVKVTQIAGKYFARRIKCYVKKNQKINKGEQIGKITFGSQVILEVNKKLKLNKGRIKIGDVIFYERKR